MRSWFRVLILQWSVLRSLKNLKGFDPLWTVIVKCNCNLLLFMVILTFKNWTPSVGTYFIARTLTPITYIKPRKFILSLGQIRERSVILLRLTHNTMGISKKLRWASRLKKMLPEENPNSATAPVGCCYLYMFHLVCSYGLWLLF